MHYGRTKTFYKDSVPEKLNFQSQIHLLRQAAFQDRTNHPNTSIRMVSWFPLRNLCGRRQQTSLQVSIYRKTLRNYTTTIEEPQDMIKKV